MQLQYSFCLEAIGWKRQTSHAIKAVNRCPVWHVPSRAGLHKWRTPTRAPRGKPKLKNFHCGAWLCAAFSIFTRWTFLPYQTGDMPQRITRPEMWFAGWSSLSPAGRNVHMRLQLWTGIVLEEPKSWWPTAGATVSTTCWPLLSPMPSGNAASEWQRSCLRMTASFFRRSWAKAAAWMTHTGFVPSLWTSTAAFAIAIPMTVIHAHMNCTQYALAVVSISLTPMAAVPLQRSTSLMIWCTTLPQQEPAGKSLQ